MRRDAAREGPRLSRQSFRRGRDHRRGRERRAGQRSAQTVSGAQALSHRGQPAKRMARYAGLDGEGVGQLFAGADARERSRDLPLHFRHRARAQGRAAQPRLHLVPSLHRKPLARRAAGRIALDDRGHRMGEGGVRRAVRPVDERCHDFHVQRPLRAAKATGVARRYRHHDFLRTADRVSDAGQRGPRESQTSRRSAIAPPPAKRSTRKSSASGASVSGSQSTTATGRPRRPSSQPTCREWG